MKLWVSFFVAAVWALQLPSDGYAKNIRQLPTMYERKHFQFDTSFLTKRAEHTELEVKKEILFPVMFTLRRKYLSDDFALFTKTMDAIMQSLTSEDIESDNLEAIIVSKYADAGEYTEEDAAYFEAFSELFNDPDLPLKLSKVVEKKYPGKDTGKQQVLQAMFDLIAGMSIEELNDPNFPEILVGKMDDFFFNETKGSSRRASFHNMKRKASMAGNTKNIRQLPTMYEGKPLKLVTSVLTKRDEDSALRGKELVVIPAVFTLRRKYLSDDFTLFGDAIDAVMQSLTPQDIESDNVEAIIVSKFADDSEYTEEDAAYFEAFSKLWSDPDLPENLRKMIEKNFPRDNKEDVEAVNRVWVDLVAGMSIEELEDPKFLEILVRKMNDFFSNETRGSSRRRASFHNMKRKMLLADNVL